MGVVGMPHEMARTARAMKSLSPRCLSEAGYATPILARATSGDIEESYLHNQGFDEALFTPMNQITSLYSPMGDAVNAVLGFTPRSTRPIPTASTTRACCPTGWVMNIEGAGKGEQGKEWCGTSNECYDKMDPECEKRTLDFIRRNAKAGKPFFVGVLAQLPELPQARHAKKKTQAAARSPKSCSVLDDFRRQD